MSSLILMRLDMRHKPLLWLLTGSLKRLYLLLIFYQKPIRKTNEHSHNGLGSAASSAHWRAGGGGELIDMGFQK